MSSNIIYILIMISILKYKLQYSKIFSINKLFTTSKIQPSKYYCLSQFPYPSGNLHMGHARVYFISDIISQYHQLKGKKVIHPIGWDSFGLPAQNAAIQRKIQPKVWTQNNISQMKSQMQKLGIKFDWNLQLATHLPDYYKWTQKIFLQLYKNGLAYKKQAQVNWDPVDKTVLANQQVDSNGNSWRSGAKVEKKRLNQWFFKITQYAQQLQQDLKQLNWPQKVKQMQKGWIGRKQGHIIDFIIKQHINSEMIGRKIRIFTTRIQTIMGCTFIATSSQTRNGNILGYVQHPITKQNIGLYEADYVLKEYGTGNVMGVPSHNQKDEMFAKQNNIKFKCVLQKRNQNKFQTQYLINSNQFTNLQVSIAKNKIYQQLKINNSAHIFTTLSLKDWLVSRQRYWGCPIPMVYCNSCGVQPVQQKSLPVILPSQNMLQGNPLLKQEFKKTICPKCKSQATRQTDTLDTFVDSSWYYLRYLDNKNDLQMFNKQLAEKYIPVDIYIGGIQHAIMHLLYARFIHKFLNKRGFIPKHKEPFKELIVQGLVKGKTYKLKQNGKYLKIQELKNYDKQQIIETFQKMSKSKFNGINPIQLVQKYGSDALKLSLIFSAPLQKDIEFKEQEVQRMVNYLNKINGLIIKINDYNGNDQQLDQTNTDKMIGLLNDMELSIQKSYSLHVYIARLMQLNNLITDQIKKKRLRKQDLKMMFKILIICMKPVAPQNYNRIFDIIKQWNTHTQLYTNNGQICWPNKIKFAQKFKKNNGIQGRVFIKNKFITNIKLKSQQQIQKEALIKTLKSKPQLAKYLKPNQQIKLIIKKNNHAFIINII